MKDNTEVMYSEIRTNGDFEREVLSGLTAHPKYLPSKYFYDEKGDSLFQEIMNLEEYYLTNCEYGILSDRKKEILNLFLENTDEFKLVEFGAGDGKKTKLLLRYFVEQKTNFEYMPIDISGHVLDLLSEDLASRIPELKVKPICDEYFSALEGLKKKDKVKKVVMFLGSNIGNFRGAKALEFLTGVSEHLNRGDLFFVGMDLRKDPSTILSAYNDSKGVTREFNFNLLKRINRELDGDFNPDAFLHYPVYDPQSGEARSYLVSTKKQTVTLGKSKVSVEFDAWESIHLETSRKYSMKEVEQMADAAGFRIVENFSDADNYFVDSVWTLK